MFTKESWNVGSEENKKALLLTAQFQILSSIDRNKHLVPTTCSIHSVYPYLLLQLHIIFILGSFKTEIKQKSWTLTIYILNFFFFILSVFLSSISTLNFGRNVYFLQKKLWSTVHSVFSISRLRIERPWPHSTFTTHVYNL